MYPNKTEAENKEVIENEVKELNEDEIEQVAGAGNPFEDIPRVPLQPIDDKLRNKG